MYIWFPYKTPELFECQYNTLLLEVLSDFEHLGLSTSEHAYFSDSVPVGVPQITSTPENLSRPARKSGNHRKAQYILRQTAVQEKKCARKLNIGLLRQPIKATEKTHFFWPQRAQSTQSNFIIISVDQC
jgi:hypothetical protein